MLLLRINKQETCSLTENQIGTRGQMVVGDILTFLNKLSHTRYIFLYSKGAGITPAPCYANRERLFGVNASLGHLYCFFDNIAAIPG